VFALIALKTQIASALMLGGYEELMVLTLQNRSIKWEEHGL